LLDPHSIAQPRFFAWIALFVVGAIYLENVQRWQIGDVPPAKAKSIFTFGTLSQPACILRCFGWIEFALIQ